MSMGNLEDKFEPEKSGDKTEKFDLHHFDAEATDSDDEPLSDLEW